MESEIPYTVADILKKFISLGFIFCFISKMESSVLQCGIVETIKSNNPNKVLVMKQISVIVSSLFKLFFFFK